MINMSEIILSEKELDTERFIGLKQATDMKVGPGS